MRRIDLIQGSPDWHEFRKNHIGSSDISVIMGINPWKTPYQLWEEKLGIRQQQEPNEAMKRGAGMEAEALSLYNDLKKYPYVPTVFESDSHPYMSASIDGTKMAGKIVVNAVEIKCCGPTMHNQLINGEIPDHYNAQMQWQMGILDLCAMDLLAYHSPTSYKIITIERDFELTRKMFEKATEFWNCVLTKTAPPLTDKDYQVKDDLTWLMTVSTWKDAKAMLAYYEAKEKELRESLIQQAGSSNARGCGIKLTKVIRRGAIDYDAIPQLIGLDLEAYRKKEIESYRITNE